MSDPLTSYEEFKAAADDLPPAEVLQRRDAQEATRLRWFTPLAIAVIVGMMALPLVLSFCSVARSHDFYDAWCCSGHDCTPAPLKSVAWTPSGWLVSTPTIPQTVVPFDDRRIRYVPPEETQQFYICEWPPKHLRCLYQPEPGG